MKPVEFKDMIMRTFLVHLTWKELGALTKHYDTTGTDTVDTKAFLTHFTKLARSHQSAVKKHHVDDQRALTKKMEQDKALDQQIKVPWTHVFIVSPQHHEYSSTSSIIVFYLL